LLPSIAPERLAPIRRSRFGRNRLSGERRINNDQHIRRRANGGLKSPAAGRPKSCDFAPQFTPIRENRAILMNQGLTYGCGPLCVFGNSQKNKWETLGLSRDSVIPPESCETPGVHGDLT
jgi:hypothetical protein